MIWLKQFGVAAIYVLFGQIIHHYFISQGIVSIFWPGSGWVLGTLLIGGKRYLCGVLGGSLLLNALSNDSLWVIFGFTLANIIEAMLGLWLLRRNNKFSSSLNTLSDYLRLIVLGGGIASMVAAVIGAFSLLLAGYITPSNYFLTAWYWWMGDVLGVVLVTPLILVWKRAKLTQLFTARQGLEAFLLVGITFMVGQIVFLDWFNDSFTIKPKEFVLFLFITWIAIRLRSMRATTLTLNMIAIQALLGTYIKVGYFANDINDSFYNYWFFIFILSGVGLTLTLYVNELKQKELTLRKSETHLRLSQSSGGIGTWEADLITHKQTWSEGCTDLIGFPPMNEPTWDDFLAIVHLKDRQRVINATQAHIEQGTKYDVEYRIINAKGDIRWMRSTGQVEQNINGKPTIMRGIVQDITERKQVEKKLREQQRLLTDSQAIAHVGSWMMDINTNRLIWSDETFRLYGLSPTEQSPTWTQFLELLHPDDRQQMHDWCTACLSGQKMPALECRTYPINGISRWLLGCGSLETKVDGEPWRMIGTVQDITERKLSENKIERLAFYDPLTGLPNRRLLMDRLKQALAASTHSKKRGVLLFIDLDNFKTLNDTLGHNIGDLLLQQVAQRLTDCVRENDTVARLSGDEFVVILEDLSRHLLKAVTQADIIGEKILLALNQPYQLAAHSYYNSSSMGATLFSDHEQPIEELLKQADIAMYQAKAAGRNTLRFFDVEMQARINARVALEADLRLALAENQFKLYYQLQNTHDKHVIGAEVLIRWQHPQRGLVSPNDFIPLAEETGLILPIGQWVLETACAQIKLWESSVHTQHLQLAVNVSAMQFRQTDFVDRVHQALRHSAISPDRLKLELTESLILDNINDTIQKMNALRKIGTRFSMDDFGTGYSSLAYLTQLPLDQLKIDQSFIHNIGIKPADAVIVQTIVGMARNLGIEVIAEGVETEAQRAFLELHGCALCQGYLFSQPVPIEQFEALLEQK
jgi:diguanylate cyclase (GGDEF)-like protein/PAS domain S-box-containing protein